MIHEKCNALDASTALWEKCSCCEVNAENNPPVINTQSLKLLSWLTHALFRVFLGFQIGWFLLVITQAKPVGTYNGRMVRMYTQPRLFSTRVFSCAHTYAHMRFTVPSAGVWN